MLVAGSNSTRDVSILPIPCPLIPWQNILHVCWAPLAFTQSANETEWFLYVARGRSVRFTHQFGSATVTVRTRWLTSTSKYHPMVAVTLGLSNHDVKRVTKTLRKTSRTQIQMLSSLNAWAWLRHRHDKRYCERLAHAQMVVQPKTHERGRALASVKSLMEHVNTVWLVCLSPC